MFYSIPQCGAQKLYKYYPAKETWNRSCGGSFAGGKAKGT